MKDYKLFKMMECLRLQTQFRDLKRKYGADQASELIAEALRLEFDSDLEIVRPVPEKTGVKNSPVVLQ
jgi:hypothetical protein